MRPNRKYTVVKICALTYSIIMLGVWVLLAQNPYPVATNEVSGVYPDSSHHHQVSKDSTRKKHGVKGTTGYTGYTGPIYTGSNYK